MGWLTIWTDRVVDPMAPAIVHFTVGFVAVLAVVWLLPLTRYRLTAAFLGGIWGVAPDAHHLFDGSRGERIRELHDSSTADVFFFHYTLDQPWFRAHEVELTFVALAALGVAFVLYDWRFGQRSPTVTLTGSTQDTAETDRDRL